MTEVTASVADFGTSQRRSAVRPVKSRLWSMSGKYLPHKERMWPAQHSVVPGRDPYLGISGCSRALGLIKN